MPSIFLCHSSVDKPFVHKLAERLIKAGISVWLDEFEIGIGDSIIEKIGFGIRDVDYIAIIISEKSLQSSWVRREMNIAMTKEIEWEKLAVLPIRLDDSPLPPFLLDKRFADFRNPLQFEDSLLDLLFALKGIKKDHLSYLFNKKGLVYRGRMMSRAERDPPSGKAIIFIHDHELTIENGLRMVEILSEQGIISALVRHRDARAPDAMFISKYCSPEVAFRVIDLLPTIPRYIYKFDYPSPECGNLSEYSVAVGLHSDFHEINNPKYIPQLFTEEEYNLLSSSTATLEEKWALISNAAKESS